MVITKRIGLEKYKPDISNNAWHLEAPENSFQNTSRRKKLENNTGIWKACLMRQRQNGANS